MNGAVSASDKATARGRSAALDDPAIRALLSPGMATQVEIITGRRRVIDYVFSPIARATSEAGRER
jgi:hemolysin D